MMNISYEDFLKLKAKPWTHWKFNVKRANDASSIVLIADTFYQTVPNPETDFLIMMDVEDYPDGAERKFKPVPAMDFYTLFLDKKIEPFTPRL